ncbi:MAG: hypothetical protein ABI696_11390 [Rubrivivax sp.]
MKRGGTFLAGATSRLLPMSIPFRFFGTALVFHLLAWLALLAGAQRLPRFIGGLDWPLAALHLVTLGVLVMTALGASLQLLPVATRQAVRSTHWPAAVWAVYTPGVAAVTLGMGLGRPAWLGAGAVAVTLALLAWAALLANNLRGARGMPGVVVHGWAAIGCLLVLLVSALSLTGLYLGLPLLDRATALALHITFAVYGFMGLLALGLSYILVPMFALSVAPDERQAIASCALAVAALGLSALAAFGLAPLPLRLAALALGASAVALHLHVMRAALRTGLRQQLGRSFTLVRIAWACLALSLLLALGLSLDVDVPGTPTLWALVGIGGWLLGFLLGMLQRILPFLASMHASRSGRRPPTPSALTAQRPLALHFAAHLGALAGLALAIVFDSPTLAALAAAVGAMGAVALLIFFVVLWRRTRGHAPAGERSKA